MKKHLFLSVILIIASIGLLKAQTINFPYTGGAQVLNFSGVVLSKSASGGFISVSSTYTTATISVGPNNTSSQRSGTVWINTQSGNGTMAYSYTVIQAANTNTGGGSSTPHATCTGFSIFGPSPVTTNNGHIYTASGGTFSSPPTYTWSVSGGSIVGGQGTSSATVNFANWWNAGTVYVNAYIGTTGVGCSTSFHVIPF